MLTRLRQKLASWRARLGFLRVLRDRRAVTSIEYGLIALIIILGIIVGGNKIGTQLGKTFNNVSSEL